MLEAGLALVTVGEIVGDRRDALVAEFFRRIFAKHVHRLRGGADGMQDEIILLLLREVVLSGGGRRNERHPRFLDVIIDGQGFERRQWTDDHMDLVAFDQLLRLGLRSGRIASGVGDDELDLPSGDRVVALLEKELDPLFHLTAPGGKRAGANGQKADAYRFCLRVYRGRKDSRRQNANRRCNAEPFAQHRSSFV